MENNQHWKKVEHILDKVLALPEHKRQRYIDNVCQDNDELKGEITRLLDSIFDSEGWLDNPEEFKDQLYQSFSDGDTEFEDSESLTGCSIGAYTITKLLGKGGMGSVYLAERSDGSFDHKVAVKVVREGRATKANLKRFNRERNILAGLNHPGIAKLFDGGISEDGFPYFIMEYVDGIPIDNYCQKHNLSTSRRIDLFKKVLEAVRHAHENLVIHRDLKPGNILINQTEEVKILDFGISKLLEEPNSQASLTQTRTRLLTPKYAAPEQIKQQAVTTATDIYALGIVFYKLLCQSFPYDFEDLTPYEIEQRILNQQPFYPSTNVADTNPLIQKELKGDLDAIALKAIRQEPEERYRGITEFLDDLNSYQQGTPVSACEDTTTYRVKKFFNRHSKGVSIAASVFLLVISLIGFYTHRISEERNQAQLEASKAEEVTSFLMDLFEANDPTESLGNTITANELLERGISRAEQLQGQPGIQAQMFDVIGQVYRRLGQYQRSGEFLERAVNIRRLHYGSDHLETAESLDHLGLLRCEAGFFQAAENLLRESISIRKNHLPANHLSIANSQATLAYSLRRQGKYGQAEKLYQDVLAIRRNQLGSDHPLTIESISSLGITNHNQGNYDETEKYYREALELRKQVLGDSHPDVAASQNNLGALLMNTGQFEEAQQLLHRSLTMREKLLDENHPKIALSMNNLALVSRDLGNFAAAESLFQKVLQMRNERLGFNNVSTAITRYAMAGLMLRTDRPNSALTLYEQALSVFKNKLSDEHSFTARTIMGIGSAYLAKDSLSLSEEYLNRGFDTIRQIHPVTSLERALAEYQMGELLIKQRNYVQADSFLTQAYQTLQHIEGASSPRQERVLALHEKLLTDQQLAKEE